MRKSIQCWTVNYPRPIGVEPTVYLSKPEFTLVEVEGMGTDPYYSTPEVTSHATIMGAIKYIVDFNWSCDYLKEIKVVGVEK